MKLLSIFLNIYLKKTIKKSYLTNVLEYHEMIAMQIFSEALLNTLLINLELSSQRDSNSMDMNLIIYLLHMVLK